MYTTKTIKVIQITPAHPNGRMGLETGTAMKKLASDIANKRGEKYSAVKGLLSCRLSFCLIRAAIACLRGTRRRIVKYEDASAVLVAQEVALDINT